MRCDVWGENTCYAVTGFVSSLYKESLKINKRNHHTDSNNWFTQEETQTATGKTENEA